MHYHKPGIWILTSLAIAFVIANLGIQYIQQLQAVHKSIGSWMFPFSYLLSIVVFGLVIAQPMIAILFSVVADCRPRTRLLLGLAWMAILLITLGCGNTICQVFFYEGPVSASDVRKVLPAVPLLFLGAATPPAVMRYFGSWHVRFGDDSSPPKRQQISVLGFVIITAFVALGFAGISYSDTASVGDTIFTSAFAMGLSLIVLLPVFRTSMRGSRYFWLLYPIFVWLLLESADRIWGSQNSLILDIDLARMLAVAMIPVGLASMAIRQLGARLVTTENFIEHHSPITEVPTDSFG